jgi:hypothetical protein
VLKKFHTQKRILKKKIKTIIVGINCRQRKHVFVDQLEQIGEARIIRRTCRHCGHNAIYAWD